MTKSSSTQPSISGFTPYQMLIVSILAFLQFTVVLDFTILSPLGAILMPELRISAAQFGLLVSAYAFSAGISAFLTAGFADRYDRKNLLLLFYTGFLAGTLLCGLAHTYLFLLFARVATGVFGGVVGSIGFAIATDLFHYELRARVMAIVQTSFSVSRVLGIPAGLYLANHFGWNAPFFLIVALGTIVGLLIATRLRSVLVSDGDRELSPFHHLLATVTNPRYIQGFVATALLSIGAFMIMPFGSSFMIGNLGVTLEQIPIIYGATGIMVIITSYFIGRAADHFGKMKVFTLGTVLNVIFINVFCRLEVTPIIGVIAMNVLVLASGFSRTVSSAAMVSVLPVPAERGAYMAVSSSLQQVSGGVAALLSGVIVVQTASGRIEHFDRIALVVTGAAITTWIMICFLNRYIRENGLAR